MDRRAIFGIVISIVWIAAFVWMTVEFSPSGKPMWTMPPADWGQWVSGLAAPLAFLWLIIGYFQQGEELRANVEALRLQEEALRLQVQELNESVKQQTAMARTSARQVELAEKAQLLAIYQQVQQHQPAFSGFVPWDPRADSVIVAIQNVGEICFNARLWLNPSAPGQSIDDGGPGLGGGQPWHSGAERKLTFYLGDQKGHVVIRFGISYQDRIGTHQTQTYVLDIPRWPPVQGEHLMATRETFGFVMPNIESLVTEEQEAGESGG